MNKMILAAALLAAVQAVVGKAPSAKECPRCNGTGYKPQRPYEYGLAQCDSCMGTGKVAF